MKQDTRRLQVTKNTKIYRKGIKVGLASMKKDTKIYLL